MAVIINKDVVRSITKSAIVMPQDITPAICKGLGVNVEGASIEQLPVDTVVGTDDNGAQIVAPAGSIKVTWTPAPAKPRGKKKPAAV